MGLSGEMVDRLARLEGRAEALEEEGGHGPREMG
jgi:hypothetical protein